jgi:hypothetical protein
LTGAAANVGMMFLATFVLAALALVIGAVLIRPAWVLLGLLVHLEMAWLLVNGPVEGPVLLRLADKHGLTLADLLIPAVIPVLVLSTARLLREAAHHADVEPFG